MSAEVNNNGRCVCAECGVVVAVPQLAAHMRRHLGYRPYACSRCAYAAYTEADVHDHARRSHGDQNASVRYNANQENEQTIAQMIDKVRLQMSLQAVKSIFPPVSSAASGVTGTTAQLAMALQNTMMQSILSSAAAHMHAPIKDTTNNNTSLLPGASGRIVCQQCGETMVNDAQTALSHAKTHLSLGCATCPACLKPHGNWSTLTQHVNSNHAELSRALLRTCGVVVIERTVRCIEMLYKPIPHLHCLLCKALVLMHWRAISDHMHNVHGDPLLQCGDCSRQCSDTLTMIAHSRDAKHMSSWQLIATTSEEQLLRAFSALAPPAFDADYRVDDASPVQAQTDNSNQVETSDSSSATIACQVCGASISRNMSCLIAHAKVHLAYKPLKCEYCSFRHFAMSKIRRHNARVHAGKAVRVSYHPITDIGSQVKDMKRKCFGAYASSTVWDRIDNGELQIDSELNADNNEQDYDIPTSVAATSNNTLGNRRKCFMCHTMVYNNTTAMEQHAGKHINYKPYHCQYCPYDSYARDKVLRHLQVSHANAAARVSYRPQPSQRARAQQLARDSCFPMQQPVSTPKCSDSVQCLLCNEKCAATEHALEQHCEAHINEKYYHCPVCTYQTTFLIRAKQHVHSAHPASQETRILCCPQDGVSGLHNLHMRCFDADIWWRLCMQRALTTTLRQCSVDESTPQMCRLCAEVVAPAEHLLEKHVQLLQIYKCTYCSSAGRTELDVKQHIINNHKNANLTVSEDLNELRTLIASAYTAQPLTPHKNGSSFRSEVTTPTSLREQGSTSTTLKKLTCQLCRSTIADNPKSIGIHVKNHLNYKPYRCPYCKYQSCEQSKARRHVEHVHNVSGDLQQVLINTDENIKERIVAMKMRCFPGVTSLRSCTPVDGTRQLLHRCHVCNTRVSADNMFEHVRLMHASYTCKHCGKVVISDANMRAHIQSAHGEISTAQLYTANDIVGTVAMCFPDTDDSSDEEMGTSGFDTPTAPCTSAALNVAEIGLSQVVKVSSLNDTFPINVSTPLLKLDANMSSTDGPVPISTCALCNEHVITGAERMHVVDKHVTHWRCSECEFSHATEDTVTRHAQEEHESAVSIRLDDQPDDVDTLLTRCFPEGLQAKQDVVTNDSVAELGDYDSASVEEVSVDDSDIDLVAAGYIIKPTGTGKIRSDGKPIEGPRYVCQLCGAAVSMYASSLYVHVKNHMNYKPYACSLCDYRTPVKSKARRHVQNAHRGGTSVKAEVRYEPLAGIEQEISQMKRTCFPEVQPLSSAITSGKEETVTCRMCAVDVTDSISAKQAHVRTVHLSSRPYRCAYCTHRGALKSEVRRHQHSTHAQQALRIFYAQRDAPSDQAIADMISACFEQTRKSTSDSAIDQVQ